MEEESSSKRKLKSLLEEVGITPSIRDIGKDMILEARRTKMTELIKQYYYSL